eukprot:SAG31_NODE_74_length_27628_cov_18.235642_12_plen_186_part_00
MSSAGLIILFSQIQVTLPLSAVDHSRLQRGLEAVRPIVEQAKANLSVGIAAISADLARLAVFMLGDTQLSYAKLLELVPQHHPDLQPHCAAAAKAVDDYIAWIKGNLSAMAGRVGVGRANYDWLMTNVYMFPYTWDQIRMIVELEVRLQGCCSLLSTTHTLCLRRTTGCGHSFDSKRIEIVAWRL